MTVPYSTDPKRASLEARMTGLLREIREDHDIGDGDLNFVFSRIAGEFIAGHGLRYTHLNTVVGAMECAKLELYRRVAAPYENIKIAENGDVFPSEILPS